MDATPEETRALRPSIRAALHRWRCPDGDIEDFCQDVEIITWQAIVEQRVLGDRYNRPEDALLGFMFQVAWNAWRNHSRKQSTWRELLCNEMPDMVGPNPDACLEARDSLQRIAMHPDVARILLVVLDGPYPERREGLPKSTFWSRREQARKWAKDVDAGHWREPPQPVPATPWKRKGRR
ncbi:MAG: sigma-70 family RNA polymerase sigma factor [Polyangiaceae bacterium]|nr:sigma-70 family RNA polymerase sigma factor [Polyangiaceae bacterium]